MWKVTRRHESSWRHCSEHVNQPSLSLSATSSGILSSVDRRTLRSPCRRGGSWVGFPFGPGDVAGCGLKQERSINVAKLLRAYGGCLGIRRR